MRKTRQQKQREALERFSVRPRREDEEEDQYLGYLARKQIEKDALCSALNLQQAA